MLKRRQLGLTHHDNHCRSEEGRKVGYIRLIVFSKNAAKDVSAALQDLATEDVESVILDLRDNIGGVIFSGYEARLPPNTK